MSMVTADSFHRPSEGMKPSWYFTCFGVVSKRPLRTQHAFLVDPWRPPRQ
jgi:hypothetical protein